MDKSSEGVAAANLAAADSLPFLPHSYELTPHCRRMRGTCIVMVIEVMGYLVEKSATLKKGKSGNREVQYEDAAKVNPMQTEKGVGDDGAVIGALGNSYRPSSCCDPALNCNPAVDLVVLVLQTLLFCT